MEKRGWMYRSFVLTLCIGFVFSCKKMPEQFLIAKTHEGRNMLAYMYDGGNVVGGDELIPEEALINKPNGDFEILHVADYWGGNLRLLFAYDSIANELVFDEAFYELSYNRLGYLDTVDPGYLSVDYQSENILAGSFEFNFVRIDSLFEADTLIEISHSPLAKLTNGRFDVKH